MRWVPYVAVLLMVPALYGVLPGDIYPADAPGRRVPTTGRAVTAVLAAPDDPYRDLAGKIADRERARLADDWDAALSRPVDFLLWVVSPARLSDAALVEAGLRIRDAGMRPAVGIITGSSVESAGSLYRRGGRASGRRALAVLGEYPPVDIDAPRQRWVAPAGGRGTARPAADGRGSSWQPATLASVTEAMVEADYVAFNGHGTAVSWRLDPGPAGALRADHVPRLWSTVVTAAACQTLRPWVSGSIALAFVDRGAAGYAGYTYSPLAGYGLGPYDGVPLRHTWSGFPVGQVVRLQNLAAGRGFAKFPQYWLLGDPRMALRGGRPYRRGRVASSGEGIRVRLSGVPAGWLPARIPGGAGYPHVRVVHAGGEIVAWEGKPLYDSRIQTADQQRAKLVLVHTPGGDVTVELRRGVPLGAAVADVVAGSLDHTLIHLPRGGGDLIALLAGLTAMLGVVRVARRRGAGLRAWYPAVAVGLAFGAFHALWSLARLDVASIVSKPLSASPAAWVATALLAAAATRLFLGARSRAGRIAAIPVATFPAWAPAAFALTVWAGSEVMSRGRLATSPYSPVMALPPAVTTLAWGVVFLAVAGALARFGSRAAGASATGEDPPED